MAYRASIGLRNGGRILGYDLNPTNRGIPLVNKDQAKVVRDIYDRYLEFGSVGKVVRYLSKKGVTRPTYTSRRGQEHGGGPFAVQTVINILRNPFYVGKITHKGDLFDGQHEAIIDGVTWEKVQRLLGKEGERPRGLPGVPRRRNADAPLHIYKLKGMLRCGRCGSYMTPTSGTNSTGKNYFYYECTRHAHVGTEACSTPYLPAVAIEELIVGRLREIANDEAALRELTRRANEDQAKAAAALEEREGSLEKKLTVLRERMAPLLELIETQGRSVLPSIEERLSKLEAERRSLDEELRAAAHERKQLEERTLRVEVVVDAYRALREALASDDARALESVLPTVIETITWTPENEGRGGCYNLALYENPLELQGLRVPGEPARDACSLLEGVWLPHLDSNQEPTD